MRRRDFIALLGSTAVSGTYSAAAPAQQPTLPIVGFLSSLSAAAVTGPVAAFRQGLASVGYEEGKNVTIEFRWAEGHYDQLPALAAELVDRRPAVIVSVGGDPPAFAAKAAAATTPLVFMVGQDPVKLGLVTSLSRPGGNATGVNLLVAETESKRIELLRGLTPGTPNFAALINPANADAEVQSSTVRAAAEATGQRIEIIDAGTDADLENAFDHFTKAAINGFLVLADPFFVYRRQRIITEAAQRRIPGVYFLREFAASGGLASYGTSLVDAYRQVGIYTGKILDGAKPADLPVVQATKFQLVINLTTAKALGLTVPGKLLALADEVIE